mmetsp:Transcript_31631/g.101140  ORF Transcript_31631/g.101140 Transcript_31631/m.101140 type:complete len:222 (-) Transcript_31631:56-721(-)
MLAVHGAARAAQRVPHPRAQCAERRAQVPLLPLRVHWRDGARLRVRRRAAPRGRAHRPGPGPPADGVHHGQAHGARLGRARARGRDAALPQPAVAKHLRDVAPRHQRRHGGHRGHALLPRPDGRAPLHVAGALPPGAKGSRGLLEDLQQPLHRVTAGNGGCVPAHRRRRPQPVRPHRAGPVPLRAAATCPLLSASLWVRPLFSVLGFRVLPDPERSRRWCF